MVALVSLADEKNLEAENLRWVLDYSVCFVQVFVWFCKCALCMYSVSELVGYACTLHAGRYSCMILYSVQALTSWWCNPAAIPLTQSVLVNCIQRWHGVLHSFTWLHKRGVCRFVVAGGSTIWLQPRCSFYVSLFLLCREELQRLKQQRDEEDLDRAMPSQVSSTLLVKLRSTFNQRKPSTAI